MPEDKVLYYPVWVSQSGRVSLRWGAPCDAPSEALRAGKAKVTAGEATMCFVVQFASGNKTPMSTFIHPASVRQIVAHWEALWASTDSPRPK